MSKFTLIICNLLLQFALLSPCKADNVNCNGIRVSLLTCSSGGELYTAYGHSAIRVTDANLGLDVVFNYGTFDFDTPFFYLNFLNGTLDYMLSTSNYDRFLHSYQRERRGVVENELILSNSQRELIERLLIENLSPENRFYRYDFFFDNCATRIRDIVFKTTRIDKSPFCKVDSVSFRDCLHEKVGPDEWSGFGIDLILGVRADAKTSLYDKAMLPDNLLLLMSEASLAKAPSVLLENCMAVDKGGVFKPRIVFALLFILTVVLTVAECVWRKWFKYYDVALSVCLAILSVIFWYLWVISDIRITSYNLNVLWASLLYIPLAYAIVKSNKNLIKGLVYANLVFLVVFSGVVIAGVQYASISILLIVSSVAIRNIAILHRLQ